MNKIAAKAPASHNDPAWSDENQTQKFDVNAVKREKGLQMQGQKKVSESSGTANGKRKHSTGGGEREKKGGKKGDGAAEGASFVTADDIRLANKKMKQYKNASVTARQAIRSSSAPTESINALVRLLVRHILFLNTEKKGTPITRNELNSFLSANTPAALKVLPSIIIAEAQCQLINRFGLEFIELTKKQFNEEFGSGRQGPSYFVLRSILPATLYAEVVEDNAVAGQRGFLAVVLSLIDLEGGSIEDDELWKHLEEIGMHKDTPHNALGGATPSAAMLEFIKKRYFIVGKVEGNDGPVEMYSSGENAESEIGLDNIKAFYEGEMREEVAGTTVA